MSQPAIVLPLRYEETGVQNALKGEAYADQLIKQGYSGDVRDAVAVLSSIIFALEERIHTSESEEAPEQPPA